MRPADPRTLAYLRTLDKSVQRQVTYLWRVRGYTLEAALRAHDSGYLSEHIRSGYYYASRALRLQRRIRFAVLTFFTALITLLLLEVCHV